jgi:hypothetical protein
MATQHTPIPDYNTAANKTISDALSHNLFYKKVYLTSGQLQTLNSVPVIVLDPPANANDIFVIINASIKILYNSIAYDNLVLNIGQIVGTALLNTTGIMDVNATIESSFIQVTPVTPNMGPGAYYLTSTADDTNNGDSPCILILSYLILSF